MLKQLKSYQLYIFSFLFIALNSYFIAKEVFLLAVIPFALSLIYMALFSVDKLMWFIVFTTPVSMNLEDLDFGGIGMYLPTEPLMFGVMILFFLKVIYDNGFDKKIIGHPISIAIYLQLIWIFITSVFSEMPVISFKFLLSRMWFVVCFYFLATQLFKKIKSYKIFFWSYLIPLIGVVIYAVIRLASYSFNEKAAHWVMEPFFKDHTSYGAILAMYLPICFVFLQKKFKPIIRISGLVALAIITIGTIFSYTRAAWISLVLAGLLYLIYKYKIKFKFLAIIGGVGLVLLAINWNTLVTELERNNQSSSHNLSEHVQSISNVSTDASNMERINRWVSAWRMFLEKPVLGWGPGTYVFQYAPFQSSKYKTIISTNVGDVGNAHSEYIGPLAEQGLIGMLLMVLLVCVVFYRGSQLYHKLPKGELKTLVLCLLLGLFTYVMHGFLNNYLDTDKASVPFWGFIAVIVAIDVYHSNNLLESESK